MMGPIVVAGEVEGEVLVTLQRFAMVAGLTHSIAASISYCFRLKSMEKERERNVVFCKPG